jgi:hypothetical protein
LLAARPDPLKFAAIPALASSRISKLITLLQSQKKTELIWILRATDDAEELIKVQVPLAAIQREVNYEDTLCVQWKDGFFEGIKHVLRDRS